MRTTNLTFSTGSTNLAGTLVSDDRTGPGPVVLLLPGSGPIDRDSNMKRLAIGVTGQLADHLAEEGLASFRYDKRGVGASDGDYKSAGFHDNIADATVAIAMLRARTDVDPDDIFVVGHSEGALIATELAVTDRRLAGAVLLAGTATLGEEVLRWQATNVSASLPRPVKLLLRVLRQDILRTQSKRLEQIKATTGDTARIQLVKINAKWLREFMTHDPAPSLASIQIPVLALTGSKDIQVNPDDVDRICGLVASDYSGRVIDDLTHLLRKEAGPPVSANLQEAGETPGRQRIARHRQCLGARTRCDYDHGDDAMNLYQDRAMFLDDEGITITSYWYPGHQRYIPYASITDHRLIGIGALTGRHRLVGLGFRRPRHFFHWDRNRSTKTHSVALDTGQLIHPVISPEDPHQVSQLLDEHAGRRAKGS